MIISLGINHMVNIEDIVSAEILLYVTIFMALVSYFHMAVCVSI